MSMVCTGYIAKNIQTKSEEQQMSHLANWINEAAIS